jgi:hypothetical protein
VEAQKLKSENQFSMAFFMLLVTKEKPGANFAFFVVVGKIHKVQFWAPTRSKGAILGDK